MQTPEKILLILLEQEYPIRLRQLKEELTKRNIDCPKLQSILDSMARCGYIELSPRNFISTTKVMYEQYKSDWNST